MVLLEARVMDSTHLELSRPSAASRGRTVLVSVAEPAEQDAERRQWLANSVASLQAAYGDSEPEYTPAIGEIAARRRARLLRRLSKHLTADLDRSPNKPAGGAA